MLLVFCEILEKWKYFIIMIKIFENGESKGNYVYRCGIIDLKINKYIL